MNYKMIVLFLLQGSCLAMQESVKHKFSGQEIEDKSKIARSLLFDRRSSLVDINNSIEKLNTFAVEYNCVLAQILCANIAQAVDGEKCDQYYLNLAIAQQGALIGQYLQACSAEHNRVEAIKHEGCVYYSDKSQEYVKLKEYFNIPQELKNRIIQAAALLNTLDYILVPGRPDLDQRAYQVAFPNLRSRRPSLLVPKKHEKVNQNLLNGYKSALSKALAEAMASGNNDVKTKKSYFDAATTSSTSTTPAKSETTMLRPKKPRPKRKAKNPYGTYTILRKDK